MTGAAYEPRYLEGIDLFNRGEFWEAHEALEDLWHPASGLERQFLQGLIQLAAAFFHLKRGTPTGARLILPRCRRYLDACPPRYKGLEVAPLLAAIDRALPQAIAWERGERQGIDPGTCPRLALDPAPQGAEPEKEAPRHA